MNNRRLIFGLLLFFIQITGYAQSELSATGSTALTGSNFPEGCSGEGILFQNGQVFLNMKANQLGPKLYLIHNNSAFEQLLLSHPTNSATAAAGWQSRLDRGQWSALAVDRPGFVLNCFGRKVGGFGGPSGQRPGVFGQEPGIAAYVDCQSVIQICSFPQANISGGSYWIVENGILIDTLSSLHDRHLIGPR